MGQLTKFAPIDLVAQGATVKPVSCDDPQGLVEATQQADALPWLTPPKLYQYFCETIDLGNAIARANALCK
ncbi:hypothetical protein ACEYW6_31325 [Nostoc sp. UIC 10607]|uniref:hypothetical protein n=1 Tax=Nostoc sp. UIC 10607 TaxID=3045935 RepID=UPI0039A3C285